MRYPVQEWEEMQPGPQDYYLQGCLILERCLGSVHSVILDHLDWLFLMAHNMYINFKAPSTLRLSMLVRNEELKLEHCNNAPCEWEKLI